jgi:hypothetical protein
MSITPALNLSGGKMSGAAAKSTCLVKTSSILETIKQSASI